KNFFQICNLALRKKETTLYIDEKMVSFLKLHKVYDSVVSNIYSYTSEYPDLKNEIDHNTHIKNCEYKVILRKFKVNNLPIVTLKGISMNKYYPKNSIRQQR